MSELRCVHCGDDDLPILIDPQIHHRCVAPYINELRADVGLFKAQLTEAHDINRIAALHVGELEKEKERLKAGLIQSKEAFRLTREYVGLDVLPEIEGWSWFDAVTLIDEVLNSD